MIKKLMCIEVKKYPRKDGTQGYKYMFLSDQDVPFVGYADTDGLVDDVANDLDEYDPTRAREYELSRDMFNDQLVYRVQLPKNPL